MNIPIFVDNRVDFNRVISELRALGYAWVHGDDDLTASNLKPEVRPVYIYFNIETGKLTWSRAHSIDASLRLADEFMKVNPKLRGVL